MSARWKKERSSTDQIIRAMASMPTGRRACTAWLQTTAPITLDLTRADMVVLMLMINSMEEAPETLIGKAIRIMCEMGPEATKAA